MDIDLLKIFNLIIGFGILNVWLLRFNKETSYRGGNAKTLKQEFEIYGLPQWFFIFVGIVKISLAILLIIGVWFETLTLYSTIGIAILMIGALLMHFKVNDPIKKSLPALSILLMLISIIFNIV
ncbi:MAG: DoxX family protein [Bacteroidota bacterium]|nr:DoxX family protein [Bacteroidota bacterium]